MCVSSIASTPRGDVFLLRPHVEGRFPRVAARTPRVARTPRAPPKAFDRVPAAAYHGAVSLFTLVVIGVAVVALLIGMGRANELFFLSVRAGEVLLVRGRIPPAANREETLRPGR